MTRKSTAYYGVDLGSGLLLELGGVFAGSEKVGRGFQYSESSSDERTYLDSGNYVLEDTIQWADTLGAKGQLQWDAGPFKMFTLGGYQGLVADAGGDYRQTWTGWMLKPTGRGNHYHAGSGFVLQMGDFQMGPNVLYQRPLVGPMPSVEDRYSPVTNTYFPGLSGRNILDDPFVVLENRETLGFEFVLTYDPTPATWLWMWDNDRRENAAFAGSLNVVYRMQTHIAGRKPVLFGKRNDCSVRICAIRSRRLGCQRPLHCGAIVQLESDHTPVRGNRPGQWRGRPGHFPLRVTPGGCGKVWRFPDS